MLIVKNRIPLFFTFLIIFLTLLVTLDRRPLFAAFIWDKNKKDIEELKTEVGDLIDIIRKIQEQLSADIIKKSVREGTRLLIERMERFKQEMETLQEGLHEDKRDLDDKVESIKKDLIVFKENMAELQDELQASKADVKADIDESLQTIRMEVEDRIGRIEVSNTNSIGKLQESLDTVSKRLEDFEGESKDREKDRENEITALKDTITEEITSLELLISEGLKKRDKEIDYIKSSLKKDTEGRGRDLSALKSTLTKNLVERDREIISLISNIQQELERKEETSDALRVSVDNIHKRLNLLNQRLSFLEKTSQTSSLSKGNLSQPTVQDKTTTGSSEKEGSLEKDFTELETLYSNAQRAVKDKDYELAMQLLKDFLYNYPDTELSDNAQYWIGEVYYDQKDFSNAILAFDKVVNRYPVGDKVPDALLKEGLSFYNLGKLKIAKIFLERVKKEYPETNLAAIAKENLDKIDERTGDKSR